MEKERTLCRMYILSFSLSFFSFFKYNCIICLTKELSPNGSSKHVSKSLEHGVFDLKPYCITSKSAIDKIQVCPFHSNGLVF